MPYFLQWRDDSAVARSVADAPGNQGEGSLNAPTVGWLRTRELVWRRWGMSKVAPLVEVYTAQQMLDLRQSL